MHITLPMSLPSLWFFFPCGSGAASLLVRLASPVKQQTPCRVHRHIDGGTNAEPHRMCGPSQQPAQHSGRMCAAGKTVMCGTRKYFISCTCSERPQWGSWWIQHGWTIPSTALVWANRLWLSFQIGGTCCMDHCPAFHGRPPWAEIPHSHEWWWWEDTSDDKNLWDSWEEDL